MSTNDHKGRRAAPGLIGTVLLIVLWGLPLGLLGGSFYGAKAEQHRSTTGVTPELVVVGSRDSAARQAVAVTVEAGAPPEASSQASGTITSVNVRVGDAIAIGQQLLSLDGRPVLALVGETPLYRDLQLGDSGSDVIALGKVLAAAGYLNEGAVGERFGPAMDAAVRMFQTKFGVRADGKFAPSSVIYVPESFGSVSSVAVVRGQVVSGAWPFMKGVESVATLSIRSATEGASLQGIDGAVVFHVGADRINLPSVAPKLGDVGPLVDALREGVRNGTIAATDSDDNGTVTHRFTGAFVESGRPTLRGACPVHGHLHRRLRTYVPLSTRCRCGSKDFRNTGFLRVRRFCGSRPNPGGRSPDWRARRS
ncbi:peptidoglycan-binding protein [Curtobacterium sp. 24E2]|nr:peptidoglycan-binding protein [Curtobacterium sp. 24E2]